MISWAARLSASLSLTRNAAFSETLRSLRMCAGSTLSARGPGAGCEGNGLNACVVFSGTLRLSRSTARAAASFLGGSGCWGSISSRSSSRTLRGRSSLIEVSW